VFTVLRVYGKKCLRLEVLQVKVLTVRGDTRKSVNG